MCVCVSGGVLLRIGWRRARSRRKSADCWKLFVCAFCVGLVESEKENWLCRFGFW